MHEDSVVQSGGDGFIFRVARKSGKRWTKMAFRTQVRDEGVYLQPCLASFFKKKSKGVSLFVDEMESRLLRFA